MRIARLLAAPLACLLAAAPRPAAATEQRFGAWSLDDAGGVCAAVLDGGGGNSLALVVFPAAGGALAIVGPDIAPAEPNSSAKISLAIDGAAPVAAEARATRRGDQTGYIIPQADMTALLDAYPSGMKLTATLAGAPIFTIDATAAAEPIAALRDCAAAGHL